MERKKFGAGLIALVAGIALSASSAFAQLGYIQGDPADGKLIPAYEVTSTQATIIGLENVYTGSGGVSGGTYIFVHVVIFDVTTTEVFNVNLCLSPYDFGFIILQQDPASAAQLAEPGVATGKVLYASVTGDFIPSTGYVTLRVFGAASNCAGENPFGFAVNGAGLAAWTIIQDVSTGFTGTEVPTTTANVQANGKIIGGHAGTGQLNPGLIPGFGGQNSFGPGVGNTVITRFDVNPNVGSETTIFVWLNSIGNFDGGTTITRSQPAFLNCEHELEVSTTIQLPFELNIIDPSTLSGIGQCIQAGQYRGVLRFQMPDTGFLWSHITQKDANFRMNFIGYNLEVGTTTPLPAP